MLLSFQFFILFLEEPMLKKRIFSLSSVWQDPDRDFTEKSRAANGSNLKRFPAFSSRCIHSTYFRRRCSNEIGNHFLRSWKVKVQLWDRPLFLSSPHPRSPVVTWWPRDTALRNRRLCLGLVFAVLKTGKQRALENWTEHSDKTAFGLRGFLGLLLLTNNIVGDNVVMIHKDVGIVKSNSTSKAHIIRISIPRRWLVGFRQILRFYSIEIAKIESLYWYYKKRV